MKRFTRAGLLLIVSLPMGTVTGQIYYKWKDVSGITRYSEDRPVESTRMIHVRNSVSAATQVGNESTTQDAEAALDAAKLDFRRQASVTARTNLRLLSSDVIVVDAGTLSKLDEIGLIKRLSADERAAAKAEAQKQIQAYCDVG
jgi:hypothetical protein